MDLTKRQQEIFDFIRKYSAKYGYPPTVRDIGKAVGLASSSTVHAHLANLEKIGLLRRDPSKPRAIELLDRAVGSAVDSVRGIVRAEGLPLLRQKFQTSVQHHFGAAQADTIIQLFADRAILQDLPVNDLMAAMVHTGVK